MIDGVNILKRIKGDKSIAISFIPTIDCTGEEVRMVAIPKEDATQGYILAYIQGGPAGKTIQQNAYFGSVPPAVYEIKIFNEDDDLVARGGMVMFGEDGFSVPEFDVGEPDYIVDGSGNNIVDGYVNRMTA